MHQEPSFTASVVDGITPFILNVLPNGVEIIKTMYNSIEEFIVNSRNLFVNF